MRIVRGGSWVNDDVTMLRCAYRHKVPPDTYALQHRIQDRLRRVKQPAALSPQPSAPEGYAKARGAI